MSIYFNASRDKEYDRGGEEILKYDRVTMNAGDGLNPESGVFTCPVGGTYMFIIHLATHKDKVSYSKYPFDSNIIVIESIVIIAKEWCRHGQHSEPGWKKQG